MVENKDQTEQNLKESDIFEWFTADAELLQEVDEFEQKQSKDMYDYANMSWNGFKVMNILLFVSILVLWAYIYIQKDDQMSDAPLLAPICGLFLWDSYTWDSCASISFKKSELSSVIEETKSKQLVAIGNVIQPLYLSTDFVNSSEVVFLYDKTKTRLKPLSILEEFDRLKNQFENADKSALECSNIEIKDNIMSAKCDAYSSDWDKTIVLPDGNASSRIGGTSISIASSFLDYIENNSSTLRVLEKPKYFSSENVAGENGGYTKKTTFFLQLEYNDTILPL